MKQKIRVIASLAFLAASPIEARSAPANSLPDLWRELSACVKVPGDGAGSELTIIFALKRDGSLLGKPRITHSHLLGDAEAQNAFVAGAIEALAKCLPASITDGLGGAIAGRPLSIRIGRLPKQTDASVAADSAQRAGARVDWRAIRRPRALARTRRHFVV
jgi:hypothetical protein